AWAAWLERLLEGEHVPGGGEDLACDGGLGVVLAAAVAEVGVQLVPGVRLAPGVLGGFDGGPAERPGAGFRRRQPGLGAIAGLFDARRHAGVADELAG